MMLNSISSQAFHLIFKCSKELERYIGIRKFSSLLLYDRFLHIYIIIIYSSINDSCTLNVEKIGNTQKIQFHLEKTAYHNEINEKQ